MHLNSTYELGLFQCENSNKVCLQYYQKCGVLHRLYKILQDSWKEILMYCQWNSFEACFKLRFLESALHWAISAACPSQLHHQGLLRLGWKAQSTWFTCLNGPGIKSWLKPWFMWQKRASYSKLVIHYTEEWLLLDSFTLCLSSLRKKCFKDLMLPSRVQAWCCLKGIRAVEFRKCLEKYFPLEMYYSKFQKVIYSKGKNEALDDGIGIFFYMFITSLVL